MKIFFFIFLAFSSNAFSQSITGAWSAADTTGFTPGGGLTCVLNGKIYVFGRSIDKNSFVEVFDPVSNSWARILNSGFDGNWGWHTFVLDSKIYFLRDLGKISVYDPLTNIHSELITKGVYPDDNNFGNAVELINNKLYVFGGDSAFISTLDIFKKMEILDFSDSTWKEIEPSGSMFPRFSSMSAVVNNRIYLFGGDTLGNQSYTSVSLIDVYDPATNVWTRLNPNGNLSYHNGGSTCVVQGKIYVLGSFSVLTGPDNNFDIYDTATNTWTVPQTSGTFTPRGGLSTAVVNNKVYALGGVQCDVIGPKSDCVLNTNEVFQPLLKIEEKSSTPKVNVFPNPTTGIFNILDIPDNIDNITIFNIQGESLFQQTKSFSKDLSLNLSKYPKGLYYLRIISPNSVSFNKIIHE